MREVHGVADGTNDLLDEVYNIMAGSDVSLRYSERHCINSAAILTVIDDGQASLITDYLTPRIKEKTVVEIGGGIGLLALHMGLIAKRVYCIEANPVWSWSFIQLFLKKKPKNVSFLFGSADEFLGCVKGDIALFCTHSDIAGMRLVAAQFAPLVIDVYSEIMHASPHLANSLAGKLREIV